VGQNKNVPQCCSTLTKSLAKEFLEILTFEYFGYLWKGIDVISTLILNHSTGVSGEKLH
jgi:hypothetical protein